MSVPVIRYTLRRPAGRSTPIEKQKAQAVEDSIREMGVTAPPPLNGAKPWELWRLVALLNSRTDRGVASEDSFLLASLERWASHQARAMDPMEVQRA